MQHELPRQAVSPGHPRRVLVADADEDARALCRQLLHENGYDVIEAPDGRDALERALVRQPAIVVSELRLPHIDGFALCEILRRDHITASGPIVVVTEETRRSGIDRIRAAGADVVLVKRTSAEVLLRERLSDAEAQWVARMRV